MVVETSKDTVCVNQLVGKKSEVLMVEGDMIVPDIKPDILNTINTSGNVCVYKKEVLEDKIRLDGMVNVYMMYLADTETSNVRGLNTTLDFTQIIDVPKCKTGMSLQEEVEIKSIECRVLNGRKVNIRAAVEAKVRVYSNDEIEIVSEIPESKDIQVLNDRIELSSLIGEGNTKTYAKDTIQIDAIDNLAEILNADIKIVNKDTKVSYNKVLAKADAEIELLYLTEDDRINHVSSQIPVMGFIDIPNISDDNLCEMGYKLKNFIVKPNTVEEHSIYIEAEVELSCFVYEKKSINLIQDLYSPVEELTFSQKEVNTMIAKDNHKETCSIHERINVPEIGSNQIYEVTTKPIINETKVLQNRVMYEGEISLNFLFESESASRIETKQVSLPFEFSMDMDGVSQNSNIETNMEVKVQDFITGAPGEIEAKIEIEFQSDVSKIEKLTIIDAIEREENKRSETYSAVIYFVKPGDTLWKIAKRFKSTIEDIARVNEIEDVNKIYPGQQLFIPRFHTRKIA